MNVAFANVHVAKNIIVAISQKISADPHDTCVGAGNDDIVHIPHGFKLLIRKRFEAVPQGDVFHEPLQFRLPYGFFLMLAYQPRLLSDDSSSLFRLHAISRQSIYDPLLSGEK